MGYDHGDSFPFDFEPNGISFGSENQNENCHHDHIPFNSEGNGNIVSSVYCDGSPRGGATLRRSFLISAETQKNRRLGSFQIE